MKRQIDLTWGGSWTSGGSFKRGADQTFNSGAMIPRLRLLSARGQSSIGVAAFAALVLALAGINWACSGGQPAAPPGGAETKQAEEAAPAPASPTVPAADEKIVIGVMPKLIGIDYFLGCKRGALKAAEELGVTIDFNGPEQADVTQQAQMIETWITKGYDAIAVAPNDPDAISVALNKAKKRGIKTLTWDTDSKPEAREWFVNQTLSADIAHTLVDIMAEGVGPDAKFIYIIGTLTAANQNTWMNLMEEYRKEKYPTMVNLSDGPKGSEEDQALATQVATDSLKAYPEMNGLFALTSVSLPGAAEALRKSNASQRVFLTGLATPNAMRQYVKDGTVKKFALWNCEDLGYLTVYAAVAAVKGELNPGATEITAGHIGAAKITGSEILLGDPLVFDANNIDQYNF